MQPRDVEEGKHFYVDVLGGELRVDTPNFTMIVIAGVEIGIGNENCTFIAPGIACPHIAFYANLRIPGMLHVAEVSAWSE